jgi:hypothetical protein
MSGIHHHGATAIVVWGGNPEHHSELLLLRKKTTDNAAASPPHNRRSCIPRNKKNPQGGREQKRTTHINTPLRCMHNTSLTMPSNALQISFFTLPAAHTDSHCTHAERAVEHTELNITQLATSYTEHHTARYIITQHPTAAHTAVKRTCLRKSVFLTWSPSKFANDKRNA